jgi:BirA family biotin operon repressor/biotin-[acetyl-CoA-carboxylase] ligase
VTILAADATADAIARATGFEAQIKWPNDLVAPAAAPRLRHRKLAGILAEATSADGRIDVVLGIGVNVGRTAYPPDIGDRATSLEAELGRPVDRGALLGHILDSLESGLDDLREGRRDAILARWLRRAPSACGARVEWEADGGRRHGATAGVDRDGALLVRTVAGLERVVGEVTWLG